MVSGGVSTDLARAARVPLNQVLVATGPPAPAVSRAITVSNGFQMTLQGVTAATLRSSPDAQAALLATLAKAAGVGIGDISLTGIAAKGDDSSSSIVSIVLHSTLVNLMTSSDAVTNQMALNATAYAGALSAVAAISNGVIGSAVTNALRASGSISSGSVVIIATPIGGVTPIEGSGFAWPYTLSSTMMNSEASLAAGTGLSSSSSNEAGIFSSLIETGLVSGVIMVALLITFLAIKAERAGKLRADLALKALAFERVSRGAAPGAPPAPMGKPPAWAWSDFAGNMTPPSSVAVVFSRPTSVPRNSTTTTTTPAARVKCATTSSSSKKAITSSLTSARQSITSIRGITPVEGMTENPLHRV